MAFNNKWSGGVVGYHISLTTFSEKALGSSPSQIIFLPYLRDDLIFSLTLVLISLIY